MLLLPFWSKGRYCHRNPSATYFCPALDTLLGIFGRNHYQNGSSPSNALSPAKCSELWLPRKCDNLTETHRQTNRRRTKWSLCVTRFRRQNKNRIRAYQVKPSCCGLKKFFEALFDLFLPPSKSTPGVHGRSGEKPKRMCGAMSASSLPSFVTSFKRFCSKGWLCVFPYICIH